jgi:hypothetical protein
MAEHLTTKTASESVKVLPWYGLNKLSTWVASTSRFVYLAFFGRISPAAITWEYFILERIGVWFSGVKRRISD